MVNLLVGTHLSSHKLSLGSLIPTVSPRTTRIQDINLRIIVNNHASHKPPFSLDEAIRTFQMEKQEMREAQKRTESQLNHLAELLQKFANQPLAQAQPSAPSPLPSQPLSNPNGGINAVQVEIENEREEEDEDKEGENDWLYELLIELANFAESDDEKEDVNIEEESEEESDEEEKEEESELAEEEDINARDKGNISFINSLFKEKKSKEIPIKCEDPGPCLVTYKIRGISIPDCLCEVYELLDLGPLKKSREVFTIADASIVC
ncbi:hypothetical protein PIB30_105159 [Stylosanthes scabra]|uniref:Uncharacterized protein n=1 Tax=Stylosanthes scabra TaxID=79078 RepID=A0ABU6ZXS4_9FABA|nr:hypothetical protein [Stylosanthes scabra]